MDIQEFSDLLIKLLQDKLGEKVCVSAYEVVELNDNVLHAVVLTREEERIGACIYIDRYFEAYIQGKSLDDVVDSILANYHRADESRKISEEEIFSIMDYSQIKDKLILKMVGLKNNEEYLKNKLYRPYLDLAEVLVVNFKEKDGERMTITVTDEIAGRWDVPVEEMFETAYENTFKKYSMMLKTIPELMAGIREFFQNIGEESEQEAKEHLEGVLVLTFSDRLGGAIFLDNKDVLRTIAEDNGCDELCIIPSSINELILVENNDTYSREWIDSCICRVNETEVCENEILSDHAYIYNRITNEIYY